MERLIEILTLNWLPGYEAKIFFDSAGMIYVARIYRDGVSIPYNMACDERFEDVKDMAREMLDVYRSRIT